MRVFGILVLFLLVGIAVFFFWNNDEPVISQDGKGNVEKNIAEKPAPKSEAQKITDDSPETSNEIVANIPQTEDNKPIIIKKKKKQTPASNAITAMSPPSFDVVRVDENCGLLVAGRAEPTAQISVFSGEEKIGSVQANSRGEWVYISSDPLPPGAQKINVKAINPNGQEMETAHLVVMQVPDCSLGEEKRAPAIALLAPKEGQNSDFEDRVSKLLQMPEPEGDLEAAKNLAVGSIDYDDKGNVALSGKGTPGNDVQVYVDNKPIGNAKVDEKGNWELTPDTEIPAGNYNLRTDQLNEEGNVISRVEIPFQRASASDVILAKGSLEIRAIVQPGNSLWRIARRMYGDGIQYTMIYQANQEQIKDPDLIFPGQIFKLPSEKVPN